MRFYHPIDFYVNLKHMLSGLVRLTSIFLMHLMIHRGILKYDNMMRLEYALSGDELGFSSFHLNFLSGYLLIWLICLYKRVGKGIIMAPIFYYICCY